MILDWDVHHGNGTNDIFYASPEVLFVSIHQSPLTRAPGASEDSATGAGLGFTRQPAGAAGLRRREFVSLVAERGGAARARATRPSWC